jgi:hypothetical protein
MILVECVYMPLVVAANGGGLLPVRLLERGFISGPWLEPLFPGSAVGEGYNDWRPRPAQANSCRAKTSRRTYPATRQDRHPSPDREGGNRIFTAIGLSISGASTFGLLGRKIFLDFRIGHENFRLVGEHHRLAAIKLDKDPIMHGIRENATVAELEAEMKKHWLRLAPVLDLEAMLAPADGTANREVPQGGAGRAGEPHD